MLPFVLAHFMYRHNARMIQPGGRFGFGAEASHMLLARQLPGEDHFQCHHPLHHLMFGLEDLPHAALSNAVKDDVIAKYGL